MQQDKNKFFKIDERPNIYTVQIMPFDPLQFPTLLVYVMLANTEQRLKVMSHDIAALSIDPVINCKKAFLRSNRTTQQRCTAAKIYTSQLCDVFNTMCPRGRMHAESGRNVYHINTA
jgi:hypothetical protein